jgi:hypothetical protein
VFDSITEEFIAVDASSCVSYGGFLMFPQRRLVKGFGRPLKPNAFSTWSTVTAEANNLQPVIGNPPKHLAQLVWSSGGYVAQIAVTETPGGHCLYGSPPYCSPGPA